MILKTKNNSIIKRYKNVGKKMGDNLYFHKNYYLDYISLDFYNLLIIYLPPNFIFEVLKYNEKDKTISFINSPDFNISDEPIVGDSYKCDISGIVGIYKQKKNPQIYHHKWLFVKDDFIGFNVKKSYNRSEYWLSKSDNLNFSKIGYKSYWDLFLYSIGDNILWDDNFQEFHSEKSSMRQVPAAFNIVDKHFGWKNNTINFDIGGGKYDDFTTKLKDKGVDNYIYDPYNRTKEENNKNKDICKDGKSDTVTIFNVLNVIKEEENQLKILYQAKNSLKDGGYVFISSAYNNLSGISSETTKGTYQHNLKQKEYLNVVRKVFPNAKLKYNIIFSQNVI